MQRRSSMPPPPLGQTPIFAGPNSNIPLQATSSTSRSSTSAVVAGSLWLPSGLTSKLEGVRKARLNERDRLLQYSDLESLRKKYLELETEAGMYGCILPA